MSEHDTVNVVLGEGTAVTFEPAPEVLEHRGAEIGHFPWVAMLLADALVRCLRIMEARGYSIAGARPQAEAARKHILRAFEDG